MRTKPGSFPGNEAGMWNAMAYTVYNKGVINRPKSTHFVCFYKHDMCFRCYVLRTEKRDRCREFSLTENTPIFSVNRHFFFLCKNRFPQGALCKFWEHFSLPESLSLNSWISLLTTRPLSNKLRQSDILWKSLWVTKDTAKRSEGKRHKRSVR